MASPTSSPPSRLTSKLTTPAMSRQPSAQQPPPRRPLARPLSTEGSVIPGETEEDGNIRREYVLVEDTRAFEFARAVDGKCY